MKKYLIVVLLLCNLVAYGQTNTIIPAKHNQYRVNLTATPQLCLNGVNVKNDDIQPNGISTRNTGGFTTGIELERKSKSGFLLNFGFQYGLRHQSVSMGYESIAFYDPSIAKALEMYGPQKEQFSGNTTYWEFRLMAGYALPYNILNGYQIEIKAGIAARTYQSALLGDYYRGITIVKNNTAIDGTIGYGSIHLGGSYPFESWNQMAQFNIMLKKDMNNKYLKNISIGVEIARSLFVPRGSDAWIDGNINSYSWIGGNYPVSTDKYVSKNLAIGLRFCAGLWYK